MELLKGHPTTNRLIGVARVVRSGAVWVAMMFTASGPGFTADNPPTPPAPPIPAIPGVPSWVKPPAIPGQAPQIPATPAKPASGRNAAPASAAPSNPDAPKLATPEQAQQLFLKGTVTGEDLKRELQAVKAAATNAKAEAALTTVIGPASTQFAGQATHNFFSDLGGKIKEIAGDLLHQTLGTYSDKVLNDFMTTLTGDDAALRKESITLPSSSNMTASQQQSVLIMAALVVGARIAHHILDAAHKDFADLEGEYATLISKRQEQAALMAAVLEKRRQALAAHDDSTVRQVDLDVGPWASPDDLTFVDSFGSDASLQQDDNDLGMQNLSMKFMEHRDPKGYAEFRAQEKGLIGRSRADLRATTGVAAFGAFSVLFMQQIVKTAQDKNMNQIMAVLPFAGDYLKEAVPLIKLSADAVSTVLVTEPGSLKHHYRLVQHGKTIDLKDADAVFGALNRSKDAIHFSDALFRNESPGYIYRIYLCDPAEAGALIDHAVAPANRKSFAEQYLKMPDGAGFSFANALNDDLKTPTGQKLAETLLLKDHRINPDAAPIGEVQRQTVSAYSKWNTTELTRLILANSQGVYAQIQVGDSVIRLIPSMATLYAYDSYADSCNRAASRGTESPDSPAPKKRPVKPKPQTPKPGELTL
jgi:hypothetical protein